MKKESLNYIASVLKGETPEERTTPDYYEIIGFLYSHRIAGLFYDRAEKHGIPLPLKAKRLLGNTFAAQKRRTAFMRERLKEIAEAVIRKDIPCVFPKGSYLSNMKSGEELYADGERVSNDIDIIVRPDGITLVADVLTELGFVQGRYDAEKNRIIPFTRLEILTRRMNRGETAPYVKLTGNCEFPFIEADINFSLGNTPNEYSAALEDIVGSREIYHGKVSLPAAPPELFFIHLILHQYKESALYFMTERGKDLELYKLADMYYMWNSGLLDKALLREKIEKHGIANEARAVLTQVREAFATECFDELINCIGTGPAEQPYVTDYADKRTYAWVGSVKERLCAFDCSRLLQRVAESKHGN